MAVVSSLLAYCYYKLIILGLFVRYQKITDMEIYVILKELMTAVLVFIYICLKHF